MFVKHDYLCIAQHTSQCETIACKGKRQHKSRTCSGNASAFVTDIATEMSVWEGVVVTPSDRAYDPAEEEEEKNEAAATVAEQMETQEWYASSTPSLTPTTPPTSVRHASGDVS